MLHDPEGMSKVELFREKKRLEDLYLYSYGTEMRGRDGVYKKLEKIRHEIKRRGLGDG